MGEIAGAKAAPGGGIDIRWKGCRSCDEVTVFTLAGGEVVVVVGAREPRLSQASRDGSQALEEAVRPWIEEDKTKA